jgi:hypothetical protein
LDGDGSVELKTPPVRTDDAAAVPAALDPVTDVTDASEFTTTDWAVSRVLNVSVLL